MRHLVVSLIAAGGATDGTIQALAGWMSPKMIERYTLTFAIWRSKMRLLCSIDQGCTIQVTRRQTRGTEV